MIRVEVQRLIAPSLRTISPIWRSPAYSRKRSSCVVPELSNFLWYRSATKWRVVPSAVSRRATRSSSAEYWLLPRGAARYGRSVLGCCAACARPWPSRPDAAPKRAARGRGQNGGALPCAVELRSACRPHGRYICDNAAVMVAINSQFALGARHSRAMIEETSNMPSEVRRSSAKLLCFEPSGTSSANSGSDNRTIGISTVARAAASTTVRATSG